MLYRPSPLNLQGGVEWVEVTGITNLMTDLLVHCVLLCDWSIAEGVRRGQEELDVPSWPALKLWTR